MSGKTVFLISANTETAPCPVYPVALARLADAVSRAGHAARLFDVLVHGREALPQALKDARPDLVGLSLRNIDNTESGDTRTYVEEYGQLVAEVRRHTPAPIILGGSGFSLFPESLMARLGADFGVVGAGEHALGALLDALDGRGGVADIPNLLTAARPAWRPCPSSPPPAGSAHPPDLVRHYWRQAGTIGVQTKRGCPKSCSYCTYPLIEGRTVQWADPVQVADEIQRMAADHGVRHVTLVDSLFNLCPERELALAREMVRRAVPVTWGAFFAPSGLDREYLGALRAGGLTHVEFGTDSLSDPMLRAYAKDFSVDDVFRASALCAELELYCAHYLTFGGPEETPATIGETVKNARRLPPCVFFPFAGVRIYPGTPLYATARAASVVAAEDDCLAPRFYFSEGLTGPRLWELLGAEIDGAARWMTPRRSHRLQPAMKRLRQRGMKGPLWELAL